MKESTEKNVKTTVAGIVCMEKYVTHVTETVLRVLLDSRRPSAIWVCHD